MLVFTSSPTSSFPFLLVPLRSPSDRFVFSPPSPLAVLALFPFLRPSFIHSSPYGSSVITIISLSRKCTERERGGGGTNVYTCIYYSSKNEKHNIIAHYSFGWHTPLLRASGRDGHNGQYALTFALLRLSVRVCACMCVWVCVIARSCTALPRMSQEAASISMECVQKIQTYTV